VERRLYCGMQMGGGTRPADFITHGRDGTRLGKCQTYPSGALDGIRLAVCFRLARNNVKIQVLRFIFSRLRCN